MEWSHLVDPRAGMGLSLLWKYCQMRNQMTLREVGEFRFYFTTVVPDELMLKVLGLQQ
jgi:hypothetical protein